MVMTRPVSSSWRRVMALATSGATVAGVSTVMTLFPSWSWLLPPYRGSQQRASHVGCRPRSGVEGLECLPLSLDRRRVGRRDRLEGFEDDPAVEQRPRADDPAIDQIRADREWV